MCISDCAYIFYDMPVGIEMSMHLFYSHASDLCRSLSYK